MHAHCFLCVSCLIAVLQFTGLRAQVSSPDSLPASGKAAAEAGESPAVTDRPDVQAGGVLGVIDEALQKEDEETLMEGGGAVPDSASGVSRAEDDDRTEGADSVDETVLGTAGEDARAVAEETAVIDGEDVDGRDAEGDESDAPAEDGDAGVDISDSAAIEKISSVNFSRNLKEYRSPKIAMFLSFLIPGLGQAYAKNYVKAGIFAAAEAAIIGGSIYFHLRGNDKRDKARAFADSLFSVDSMRAYEDSLLHHFREMFEGDSADEKARELLENIYYDPAFFFEQADDRTDDYYSLIKDKPYVQGWKDCEPEFSVINEYRTRVVDDTIDGGDGRRYMISAPDTTWLVDMVEGGTGDELDDNLLYGYSPDRKTYIGRISKANREYRRAGYIMACMIISRIISGADAAITAVAYNHTLLGRQSMFRRIRLHQQLAFDGASMSMSCGVSLRF